MRPLRVRLFSLRLLLTALPVAILTAFVALPASAKIVTNTIDPVAAIQANGRQLRVTGPVQCTAGEAYDIRVTVTQRATGAIAEGTRRLVCTGDEQHWTVDAPTRGREAFQEGEAKAVAIAATSTSGAVTDAHQWLVGITLSRQ